MINWLFIWSSKRPPVWESTIQNMNQAVSSTDYMKWNGNEWVPPVNWKDIPTKFLKSEHKKRLNGQVIEQFENESFKFVIDRNITEIEKENPLIIKPHMYLEEGLNEGNCRTLNLDEIYKAFNNYQWVALGLFFGGGTIPHKERGIALAKSILYGRNAENKLVNVVTGEKLTNTDILSAVTYVHFRMLKDNNFVICTVNPHLISVPLLGEGIVDNKHRFLTLDTYDSTMEEYLLKPQVHNAVVVKDTVFAKQHEPFDINLSDLSIMWLKFTEKPDFPVKVETNIPHKYNGNGSYTFTPDKPYGYVKLKVDTGAMIDKYNDKNFAGITTIEYIVIGEENGIDS
jgi:hypothetical protein